MLFEQRNKYEYSRAVENLQERKAKKYEVRGSQFGVGQP